MRTRAIRSCIRSRFRSCFRSCFRLHSRSCFRSCVLLLSPVRILVYSGRILWVYARRSSALSFVHLLVLSLVHPLELTHVGRLTYANSTVRTRSYMFFVHSLGVFVRIRLRGLTRSCVCVLTCATQNSLIQYHSCGLTRSCQLIRAYSCILLTCAYSFIDPRTHQAHETRPQ